MFRGGCKSLPIVEERVGFGNVLVPIKSKLFGAGCPFPVRCLVLAHKQERFAFVPFLVEPIEGHVGDNVGAIAVDLERALVRFELGIVIEPLPWKDRPFVKAGGIGNQMPFPDHGGIVAARLKEFGKGLLGAVEGGIVVVKAI